MMKDFPRAYMVSSNYLYVLEIQVSIQNTTKQFYFYGFKYSYQILLTCTELYVFSKLSIR